MQINQITANSFQHKWRVKKLFKEGRLPSIKVDPSGRTITKDNASVDHCKPLSKGGKSRESNYMLTTREFNQLKGSDNIWGCVTALGLIKHLAQFIDVDVQGFKGNEYIINLIKHLAKIES